MSNASIQKWLEQAVATRPDVASALVVLGTFEHPAHAVHWPPGSSPDAALLDIATRNLQGAPAPAPAAPGVVVRPVHSKGRTVGTLAVRMVDPAARVAANAAVLTPREVPDSDILAVLEAALNAPDLRHAAAELANRLCQPLASPIVVVGVSRGRFVRVAGIAHGSDVGQRSGLMRALGASMDEALDQGATVRHPQHPAERPRITIAHAELARLQPGYCQLTVPLFANGRRAGALSCLRPAAQPFDDHIRAQVERVGRLLAPLLLLRTEHEAPYAQRLQKRWRARAGEPGSALRRGVIGGGLLLGSLGIGLLFLPITHEVVASTRLEGRMQRVIVAPVDGYLKSSQVRPGDEVKAGQVLAEMSDDDLQLERQRLSAELARHENSFSEAQARAERNQLVAASTRVNETRAQLALVEQQLERTQLRAPFDGRVIAGDLATRLGAPLQRGEVMLTLAPSADFRVLMEIDERDVAHVQAGTRGELTLAAMPERRQALTLQRVMPVAQASDGRNVFEAEAQLANADTAGMRPGLQGVARLDAGQRSLGWVLGHRIVDWLRLQWWAWVG